MKYYCLKLCHHHCVCLNACGCVHVCVYEFGMLVVNVSVCENARFEEGEFVKEVCEYARASVHGYNYQ